MEKFILNSIGKITVRDNQTVIELDKKYIPALNGLDGFSTYKYCGGLVIVIMNLHALN